MTSEDVLLVDRSGGVATMTLNRPRVLNAATPAMWDGIGEIATELGADPWVRVVVVTGAGDAFCSGADLGGPTDRSEHPLTGMRRVAAAAAAVVRIPKPTIAKVNGVAAGAGANLALACDLVVAADTARFCEIFAKRGLSVDFGGSWLLPRLVGMHKAKELVLLADMVPAAEAERIGLVNRVVPRAELDDAVDQWAGRLAAGPPLALALSKKLLEEGLTSSPEQALEAEGSAQVINLASEDFAEAVRAWRDKRAPEFTGR